MTTSPSPQTDLPDTGERMIPSASANQTFREHVERYRFAANFVGGRDVLDIACGEGYGSAGLARAGAKSVVGVDVSPEAAEHARRKYDLDARVGDAREIPVGDRSVDVLTSFETIEHVPEPARFLDECVRVMRDEGVALISTPNIEMYHEVVPDNPFHVSEMSLGEFKQLLDERFASVTLYWQVSRPAWVVAVRRLGNVGRLMKQALVPRRTRPMAPAERAGVVELCAQPATPPGTLLRLEAVRRFPRHRLRKARYIVAVVRSPRR